MLGLARRALLLAACALAVAGLALPASASADTSPSSIVANGDFSDPNAGGGWGNWGSGITGWHDSTGCGIEVWGRGFIISAPGNSQAIELDSNCPSSISQQLATQPGQQYLVTYYFGARPGTDSGDNGVDVKWNGNSKQSEFTGDTTMQRYSFYVTADSSASAISFTDIGRGDGLGSVLARVAVTPVAAQGAPVVDVPGQNIVQSDFVPNPSTSGSFFAAGPLTIAADHSDLGHVTDNGDGTWAWTFDRRSAADPLPATVTVTATDGAGHLATDSFTVARAGISTDMTCFDPANYQYVNVTAYGYLPNSWYYPFVGIDPGQDDGAWVGGDLSDLNTDGTGSGSGALYTDPYSYDYYRYFGYGDGYSAYVKLGSYNDYSTVAQERIPVCGADTAAPAVNTAADQTAEANGPDGATVSYAAPTATDNDPGSRLDPSCTPASGTKFPLGTTTVDCSATDFAGNTGHASFNVTVHDTTPPSLSVPGDTSAEATGSQGAVVHFTAATASDTVDGSVTPDCSSASGSTFALGTTTVTCTATDQAGNKSAPKSFDVKVVDTTPPTLTLPSDFAVDSTSKSGAPVSFSTSATDTVDGARPVSCQTTDGAAVSSGSTLPIGTDRVNCSASDAAGNRATGSFNVLVRSAAQQAANLKNILASFGIDPATTGPIAAKMDSVIAAITPSGGAAAPNSCNTLTPLNNQIRAKTGSQPGKLLSQAQSDQLLAVTGNIGVLLGC